MPSTAALSASRPLLTPVPPEAKREVAVPAAAGHAAGDGRTTAGAAGSMACRGPRALERRRSEIFTVRGPAGPGTCPLGTCPLGTCPLGSPLGTCPLGTCPPGPCLSSTAGGASHSPNCGLVCHESSMRHPPAPSTRPPRLVAPGGETEPHAPTATAHTVGGMERSINGAVERI
eukprot:scaffold11235_cov98-Isochrysis_galbana.AAC.4